MSFHPKMAYDATFHKSSRQLEDEGPPFAYTAENRARFDEIVTRYPPDQRRSAVLPALYLAQSQQGYITANAIRHVAELLGITRADVEDVVSYYTMFYTRPVGKYVRQRLPDAVVRGQRRGAGDRGAGGEARDQAGRDRRERHVHADRSGMPRRVRPRAGGDGQRRLARVPEARGRRRSWSTICARAAKRRCPAAITSWRSDGAHDQAAGPSSRLRVSAQSR